MSEKGKNPSERSKGSSRKAQSEQAMRHERHMDYEGDEQPQVEESLREQERKPNRR